MATDTKYHVQMNAVTPDNTTVNVYPKNTPVDVLIDRADVPKYPSTKKLESMDDILTEMGDMAFKDEAELNKASNTNYGTVKISDTPTPDSNDAFTAGGAKSMDDKTVHKSGDEDISGLKKFEQVKIGDARFTYTKSGNDQTLNISFD